MHTSRGSRGVTLAGRLIADRRTPRTLLLVRRRRHRVAAIRCRRSTLLLAPFSIDLERAIVSHAIEIEQPGQHKLRVDVSYQDSKTFRKFYRCQVVPLLGISSQVRRLGDTQCLVQVTFSYQHPDVQCAGPLVLSKAQFLVAPGLTATRLDTHLPKNLDDACQLDHGAQVRVLFQIEDSLPEAKAKGLAVENALGFVSVEWCKAMGESGVVTTSTNIVPPVKLQAKAISLSGPFSDFIQPAMYPTPSNGLDVRKPEDCRGGDLGLQEPRPEGRRRHSP